MPAQQTDTRTVILIASDNEPVNRRFRKVLDDTFAVVVTTSATTVVHHIEHHKPQLLILDPALYPDDLLKTVGRTLARQPDLRMIVLEDDRKQPVDQLTLFKSGVHGFLSHGISSELLNKAAHAVCAGEVWVPRQLIAQLVGELARDTAAGTHNLNFAGNSSIEHLTPRELQVAEMVHRGGNNKSIARELDISERTVKAHLSAIFRKLDIENRLHLAIYFNQLK